MATKYVFEDNKSVPIGMLLSKTYIGNDIYFSGGCEKLLSKAMSIKDSDDYVIIYYDVAPNNIKTVKGYEEILKTIRINDIKNIIVIPIICIEYIVIKMLNKYGQLIIPESRSLEKQYMIDNVDWDSYINNCNTTDYIRSSIEHFYKYTLSQLQVQRCKFNSHKYKTDSINIDWNEGYGKYYYIDCPCDRQCKLNSTVKLNLKAERLYIELPLKTIKNDEHKKYLDSLGINITSKDIKEVENEIIDFYDRLCTNMRVNGFKVKIKST